MRELQLDIHADAIGLLRGVVTRLKSSDAPENVFFGASEVDSWNLDGEEYPAASLCAVRRALRDLQTIREVSWKLAAAAEALTPVINAKLMRLGFLSLPTEIFQEILCLSLDEQTHSFRLIRVVELQSVSRYFRDVIRCTPELWTSVCLQNVPLLELQLERSGGMWLHLDVYDSSFVKPGLYDLVMIHSARVQSMVVHLWNEKQRISVLNTIYSMRMDELRWLEFRSSSIPGESLSIERLQMPGLNRLLLSNIRQTEGVGTNLTEIVISYARYARWSGRNLVSLVLRHQKLEKLVLCICSPPEDRVELVAEEPTDRCPTFNRDILVILNFNSWASVSALKLVWPALCSVGIGTLKLDLSEVTPILQYQCLFAAFHYANTAPSLHTLFVSLPPYSPPNPSPCDSIRGKLEDLPTSLRTVTVHNWFGVPLNDLFTRLGLLRTKQEFAGAEPFEHLIFTGSHPPQDEIDGWKETEARKYGFTISCLS